jgi:predicted dehydrogenase
VPAEVNVAVVGLGGKGRSHASTLAEIPGARIIALADTNPEAIERARIELGDAAKTAYRTTDSDRIFADPNVDAVVIATQHNSHRPLAVAAAQARKHLLVEKPLALTAEDCQAIVAAADASRVQVVVGFQARYRHFIHLIKQQIPAPRIVVGQIIDPQWPDSFWAVDPVKGGGSVLSQGVHAFDLVCYLAGSEPASIHAVGGIFSHDPTVTPTVDTCLATVTFSNGTIATVAVGDFGPLPWTGDKAMYQVFDGRFRSATMVGTRLVFASASPGWMFSAGPAGLVDPNLVVEEHRSEEPPPGERPDYDGTSGLIQEFIACARDNRPPTIGANVRDGQRATMLVLGAFASMRNGVTVNL